jgi:hypothetical protein
VQTVDFYTINEDDVVTVFTIDLKAEDGVTQNSFSTCQPSLTEISETSVNASFNCMPELDPRDSWSMMIGVYGTLESDTRNVFDFKMLHVDEKSEFVNLTLERGTTATATVVGSKEIIEKMGDFLFLYSSLYLFSSGIIKEKSFGIVHDISRTHTNGEFKFSDFQRDVEVLEGEPFTVICDVLGRNPLPITVQKDGVTIQESDDVSITQLSSHLWSSSYVTFRHASKESKGKYSCVADNNGKQLVSPRYSEVEINPRIRWDLSTSSEDDPNLVCIL